MGISESEFWMMTIAELGRAIKSKSRVKEVEAKERASFDYILAQLIMKGTNIAFVGKGDFPKFEDVYSVLLSRDVDENGQTIQEKRQNRKDELSALRFRQFAQSFNKRFKEVAKDNDERRTENKNNS